MNQARKSAIARLALGTLCLALVALSAGCETKVIRRDGIGADSNHPTRYEPSGSDPLSRKVWGDPGR